MSILFNVVLGTVWWMIAIFTLYVLGLLVHPLGKIVSLMFVAIAQFFTSLASGL